MDAAASFDPQQIFDHPDPYPMFAMLRQSQPVMRVEFMNRASWVLTKYDDCLAVLKDADTYSSRSNAEVGKIMGRTVIEMDAKEHTRHRALVQAVFVPKGLDGLAPVLTEMVDELLAGARRDDVGIGRLGRGHGGFANSLALGPSTAPASTLDNRSVARLGGGAWK